MSIWKTLLLVYDRIDVSYEGPGKRRTHFENTLTEEELSDGIESFKHFPGLVDQLTSGAATIDYDVIYAERPLTTLTTLREHQFWPSPDDTRAELMNLVPAQGYQSLLVYWPQNNFQYGTSIPSGGWGLGMGASAWSYDATYATVANAPTFAWNIPLKGEVWLHEWLHGVCAHFAAKGYKMPEKDADGGDGHGYVRSPVSGWTEFYRDLMTCHVPEGDKLLGIPLQAWREERITTLHGTPWKL